MIEFRSFRNSDPPKIVAIWNECFTGRSSFYVHTVAFLERSIFAKPFFDRNGLILALEDNVPVGFVHAGFGPNDDQTGLDFRRGVVCAIAVRPEHRRKKIGTTLLERAEEYLQKKGAAEIRAGTASPGMPFYFALYGGADFPGFLATDSLAAPFFQNRGYQPTSEKAVFQRRLNQPLMVADPRMMEHRKNYEITIQPRASLENWWRESVIGLVEPVEFRLESKSTRTPAARALLWEMDGYNNRWNVPSVGILGLVVGPEFRRKGLGKFFLGHLMRHLQEQSFGICEAQIDPGDHPAGGLLASLNFIRVDTGTSFVKGHASRPANAVTDPSTVAQAG